jgi:hypothetical protein
MKLRPALYMIWVLVRPFQEASNISAMMWKRFLRSRRLAVPFVRLKLIDPHLSNSVI